MTMKDGLDAVGEDELLPPWEPIDAAAAPEPLWRGAIEEAAAAANRERLALELADFTPVAAATRLLEGRSMGELVMTVREWRGVASVRFGGAPALLVAELQLIDEEDADDAAERGGVRLSIVPFAAATDPARVVLEEAPGYRV